MTYNELSGLINAIYNNLSKKEKDDYIKYAKESLKEHELKENEITEYLIEFFIKDTLIRNELINGFRNDNGELI